MLYSVSLKQGGRNATLLDDIDQALSILLFTRPGERIYAPAYGCRLLDLLDAPHYFLQLALVSIVEAIGRYEKRIEVVKVNVGLPEDGSGGEKLSLGTVSVYLVYRIRSSNTTVNRLFYSDGTIVEQVA